jgi:hydrogenase/urease accessory protein HupE
MANGRAIAVAVALAALLIVATGTDAHAHAVGLSRGDYTLTGSVVTADLRFARSDAAWMDAAGLLRGILLSSNGSPCAGVVDGATAVEPDGVSWRAHFVCDDPRGPLALRLSLLAELPDGHRHAAHLQAGARATDDLLYRRHDATALPVDGAATPRPEPVATATLAGMLQMGVIHILTGSDHLAFLFGLVLVGGRSRSLFATVTAFTAAHSMTLAAATLGVWEPPARIVEPAIALSIAYVGVENFFISGADRRWRVTFPFGLLHGFGFAGALREVAMPRAELPWALLSFNAGVELGQLVVLAALLPVLAKLRRLAGFDRTGVRLLSVALVVLASVWFVARCLEPAPRTYPPCTSARMHTGPSVRTHRPPRSRERIAARCTTPCIRGASPRSRSAAHRRPRDRRNPRTPPGRGGARCTVRRWSALRHDIAAPRGTRATSGSAHGPRGCHARCPRTPQGAGARSARSNHNPRSRCPSLPRSGRRRRVRPIRRATPAQRSACGRTRS